MAFHHDQDNLMQDSETAVNLQVIKPQWFTVGKATYTVRLQSTWLCNIWNDDVATAQRRAFFFNLKHCNDFFIQGGWGKLRNMNILWCQDVNVAWLCFQQHCGCFQTDMVLVLVLALALFWSLRTWVLSGEQSYIQTSLWGSGSTLLRVK